MRRDLREDPELAANLAVPVLGVIAYAGMPLTDEDGRVLGSLCAIDSEPREWSAQDIEALADLADACSAELRLPIAHTTLSRQTEVAEQERSNARSAAEVITALAQLAMGIAVADDVATLVDVIVDKGLAALGAQGGAVAVTDGDDLRLTITSGLGEQTRIDYARLPLSGPLPASAAARGQRVMLADADACLAFSPDMGTVMQDTGCSAWVALPLIAGDAVLGSLTIGWPGPRSFQLRELGIIDARAVQCAQALARVSVRADERARTREALRMSEVLQRSLLTEPQQPDHLQVVVRYRPAAEQAQVGGDWYDSFLTRNGSTCLVIGDVTGHDRHAAAVMGQVRNLLRGVAYTVGDPPATVLTMVDAAMRDLDVGALATAVLARSSRAPNNGPRVCASCAGATPLTRHPCCCSRTARPRCSPTPTPAPGPTWLLGLDWDTSRTDATHLLPPGGTLLLYTDGLIERRGVDIDEGLQWLTRTATELSKLGPNELCDALLALVDETADDDIVCSHCGPFPRTARTRPRPVRSACRRTSSAATPTSCGDRRGARAARRAPG